MFMSPIANSCTSFTGIYFISKIINYNTSHVTIQKLIIGVISGCFGIFLITQSIEFENAVKIDFRFLVLLLLDCGMCRPLYDGIGTILTYRIVWL